MDHTALPYRESPLSGARPARKVRDPYDGLRPWSAITHGVGAVLSLLGIVLLLLRAADLGLDGWHVGSFLIYGLSMVGLYTASTLYHCLNTGVEGRVALRKYDHAAIYFLIAGTYTPVCLCPLRTQGGWGWGLLSLIWLLTIAGTVLTLRWINMPRVLTSLIYIGMGWAAAAAISPLYRAIGWTGLFWLLAGGLSYTIGGVLYALKWPGRDNPRFGCHEIFHIFILIGSLCHFALIYSVL